jgi:biotin transporter BioY
MVAVLVGVPLIALTTAFLLRRKTGRLAKFVWIASCVISIPLIGGAVILGLLFSVFAGIPDTYQTVFSPDHKIAARLEIAGRGETSVILYEHHGFLTHPVFEESYSSAEEIQWNGNRESQVFYRGSGNDCSSTAEVKVICIPLPPYTH